MAVIQNEIGEIVLDGKLLDYTVTEIDEGCVCCSLAGNLKRAVHGILEHFSPDYIILETSGLTNPLNLLDDLLRFDSTVTIVDAANLDAALAQGPLAFDQIRAADIIVLNKRDLVDDGRLEALRRRVQEINSRAPQFCANQGDLNPALVFDVEDSAGLDIDRKKPAAGSAYYDVTPGHSSHAEVGLWSQSLRLSRALDREKFMQAIQSLPSSVFRAKGLVDFEGFDETMLFQYVCGRFELSVFPKPSVRERFLTFIGWGNKPATQNLLDALSIWESGVGH